MVGWLMVDGYLVGWLMVVSVSGVGLAGMVKSGRTS
jgi:hypothetical protein